MPYVACPSCGERGKIPPTLIGTRIKCKKCGMAFIVAQPAAKAAGAEVPAPVAAAAAVSAPAAGGTDGIVVEGLDASAWAVAGDASSEMFKPAGEAESPSAEATETQPFERPEHGGMKEYKFLCSRDKIFEGKFDLPRLEEVLNHYARQGWVVKAMTTPHLKGFGEGTKEEIVVLLER